MKRVFLLCAVALASQAALGQNMISSFSHTGTFSVSTRADQWVWSLGGSPRSGFYHYWRDYLRQSTGDSAAIPLGGTSNSVSTTGNYYSPNYSVSGSASTSFTNSATEALYNVSFADQFVWGPTLPAHAAATEGSNIQDIFDFTLTQDSDVTITPTGTANYHIFIGGGVPDSGASNTSNGPISMVLLAGSYYVEVNATDSVTDNTQSGITQPNPGNVNFGYSMQVTPATDGPGGPGTPAVPEPCSVGTLALGVLAIIRRPRR